jgi:DNA mismatch repair protein MutS2
LRHLTHHAHELKQTIWHKLEQILHSQRYADVLQEGYFAQREGRYVVPVKVEMQGRVPGILHDVSASGATVFLEPRELVELNNAIKVAELEIDREVRRILRELSALVAHEADDIAIMLDVLVELDCIVAKAALSRQLNAHAVPLNGQGRIMLRQARHPLLAMAKVDVVANDLLFDQSVKVLVISGPNTGGKTVTLKILGLFALMVRAGLHLPCEPDSEMAVFPSVYADIGDAQDLAKDLSSFSAHITQVVQLLRELPESTTGSDHMSDESPLTLALLDEPVTSTDPTEGAALAAALLSRLARRGVKVVVTTHYTELKAMAQSAVGFANASVQFDLATLSPTYRIVMGLPGGSAALEIAGRLGMDEAIVEDARNRLGGQDRLLERLLNDLQERRRQLMIELEEAAQARVEARQAVDKANTLLTALQESEREERRGIKRKLSQEFQRARAAVQATVDQLRQEQNLNQAKQAKQRIAELEIQARRDLSPPMDHIGVHQLTKGHQVELEGLGMIGTLLEDPQGKKRVRVKIGEGEVVATVADLRGLAHPSSPSTVVSMPGKRSVSPGGDHDFTASNETVLDVRGLALDEAVDMTVAALDRATLAGNAMMRIIHGYGTGRLKTALRDYLARSPYVSHFRPGDRSEGGDGVTIATLR